MHAHTCLHTHTHTHAPSPLFLALLVDTALLLLFATLADRSSAVCSGNTLKKSKRQQFSAWISLWLNPLIILGFPEKEGVRWRGMFYSLITPTFTPSCLPLVVLLLVALALYSLESSQDWSYFMLRLPGPQFKKLLCVSFHTLLSSSRVLPLTLLCEPILWGIRLFLSPINRSRKDGKPAFKITKTCVLLVHYNDSTVISSDKMLLTRSVFFWHESHL